MGEDGASAYEPEPIKMRLLLITNLYPTRARRLRTLHGGLYGGTSEARLYFASDLQRCLYLALAAQDRVPNL